MTRVGLASAAVIACVSACGFQASPEVTVDSGAGPGSDGDTGGGLDDSDGDGIDDDVDNCVSVANADQHDEDGDQVGDACDPCPQVANATADRDGDGIADACDPRPGVPGDILVRFESFAGVGNLPVGWQSRGGGVPTDWQRGNDALTIAADNATRIAIFNSGSPHHAIDIGLEVSSASGAGLWFLTGLSDAKSDIAQFFGCGMRFDNQPSGRSREMFMHDVKNTPQFVGINTDLTDAPPPSGPYRIQFVMEGNRETCVIPRDGNEHRQINNFNSRNNTFVGLRANNVTVVFRYVAVYRF